MEIMGLVVIVILISLGMFFVVKFMITKQPFETKKSYTRTETTANLLNSLLKTTAEDCYGMTVTQLLQDCAVNPDNQVKCENGEHSCDYVADIVETIFDETLIKWGNQNFDLKVEIEGEKILHCTNEECVLCVYGDCIDSLGNELEEGCKGEKEAKQSYIPTDAGLMTINLGVC